MQPENIIETFAIATGVPVVLMDTQGNILHASKGFLHERFFFADTDEVQVYIGTSFQAGCLTDRQYFTLYTENRFLYTVVPIVLDNGITQVAVAGPMQFHMLQHTEIDGLLRSKKIQYRKRAEIIQSLEKIPVVSMVRLDHLGRVLWSLCHAYTDKSILVSQDSQPIVASESSNQQHEEPTITFTLVEEDAHSSFELTQYIRHIVLNGDVTAARRLKELSQDEPIDRLINTDPVRSARYNLITGCAMMAGMIFDRNVPYEQLMMTADKYIRLADKTNSIPEIISLALQSIEAFAWLVRKYSTQIYSKPVRQVIQHIQSNFNQKIALDGLAEMTGLSPSHLSRLIKKETGRSLTDITNDCRVEESKFLLLNTEYSILQISEMIGYNYQNHFALQFKNRTGVTPTAFRQTGGRTIETA